MKTKRIRTIYGLAIILVGVMLFGVCPVQATTVDFYTDGTIEEGDVYSVVNVYDSAIVDMTGGLIETRLELYNTSTVNIYNGAMTDSADITLFDSSTINLHGLQISALGNRIWVNNTDPASINIYGYGFYYVGNTLNGYWVDGTPFNLYVRDGYTRERITLIPEPATILLLSLGGLLLRNDCPLHKGSFLV